jgi:D-glycero-D-manno-heptose 1,7-bisphosphate phosphatase
MALMLRRAVFLDKDGTLIHDVPYNVEPARIRLIPRTGEGLRLLRSRGFHLVVVSNQSGVARGYFPESALSPVQRKLRLLLAELGVPLSGFYYCPHDPSGAVPEYRTRCFCRKPKPGMILKAAQRLNIDLSSSWMIGDILDDIEAGKAAGCRTVLLVNGNETEWQLSKPRTPDYFAENLVEAARLILGDFRGSRTSLVANFMERGEQR